MKCCAVDVLNASVIVCALIPLGALKGFQSPAITFRPERLLFIFLSLSRAFHSLIPNLSAVIFVFLFSLCVVRLVTLHAQRVDREQQGFADP